MHRNGIRLAAALCLASLPACNQLFWDDFEADAVGETPLLSPAGEPAGDSLEPQGPGMIEVTSDAPIGEAKSLLLAGPGGDRRPRIIFTSASFQDTGRAIPLRFRGRLSPGASARINISGGTTHFGPQIDLADGWVRIVGVEGPVGTYVPGGVHIVTVVLHPQSDTFTMTVAGRPAGERRQL